MLQDYRRSVLCMDDLHMTRFCVTAPSPSLFCPLKTSRSWLRTLELKYQLCSAQHCPSYLSFHSLVKLRYNFVAELNTCKKCLFVFDNWIQQKIHDPNHFTPQFLWLLVSWFVWSSIECYPPHCEGCLVHNVGAWVSSIFDSAHSSTVHVAHHLGHITTSSGKFC